MKKLVVLMQAMACLVSSAAGKDDFSDPMAFAKKYVVQDCVKKMFDKEFLQERPLGR